MTVDVRVMTAETLAALPDDGFTRYELVNGELRTMGPAFGRHGLITNRTAWHLTNHVLSNRVGDVLTGEAGFVLRRNPDTVRAPDVAFVRRGRLIQNAYIDGAPDLAIEVLSTHDRKREVQAKIREYLDAGGGMVILIDPENETADVHTPNAVTHLSAADVIDGGEVVPGWRLPLSELFA
jgi:Uma2 family endonuclease